MSHKKNSLGTFSCTLFSAGLFLASVSARAQTVSKVLPDKGWVLVSLKDTSGISANQPACIADTSGAKITCGKVVKVAKTVVVIKADPPTSAAQVKPGFKASFDVADEKVSVAAGKKGMKASTGKKSGQSRIRFFSGAGFGVASVSKIGYIAPPIGANGVKLWESQSKPLNMEKISFGAEFETVKAGTFGFRYGVMGDAKASFASKLVLETDYDASNRQKYVSSEHQHTVLGLYYDYAFLQPAPAKSGVRIYSGLDLVNSTAKMTGILKNEVDSSETEIATITSSLTLASLRAGVEFMLRFGSSFEMGIGLRTAVPLAALALSQETTINDENSSKSADAQDDLKVAFDHKKNAFGAIIPLSMSVGF